MLACGWSRFCFACTPPADTLPHLTKASSEPILFCVNPRPNPAHFLPRASLPEGTAPACSARHKHCLLLACRWLFLLWPALAPAATTPEAGGWFDFAPEANAFATNSAIDLRDLNEKFAGEHGQVIAKDGKFVHSGNGDSVRFWAVNGPPNELKGDALKQCSRLLAKDGETANRRAARAPV